jgi:hypothetical protein
MNRRPGWILKADHLTLRDILPLRQAARDCPVQVVRIFNFKFAQLESEELGQVITNPAAAHRPGRKARSLR